MSFSPLGAKTAAKLLLLIHIHKKKGNFLHSKSFQSLFCKVKVAILGPYFYTHARSREALNKKKRQSRFSITYRHAHATVERISHVAFLHA
jgi:hypothetical protein